MISKEEVVKMAKLARLELTEKEIVKMQKDLSSILDYFEILRKATSDKKQETSDKQQETSRNNLPNFLREDKTIAKNSSLANNLIAEAPDKKEGYIKVRSVL